MTVLYFKHFPVLKYPTDCTVTIQFSYNKYNDDTVHPFSHAGTSQWTDVFRSGDVTPSQEKHVSLSPDE